ncbi:oxysterol-binding protein-related protein 9-like isoform X2 [Varroa destructor]|uniref:Oxysterol-binding protein n=1 Tax=Varroa destructor TaxID=109461 RepID=A0A7M7KBY8_VARDE|nr:oxysterol-binding protein-related protein 9-like isoform X2 [Varroa destructor]
MEDVCGFCQATPTRFQPPPEAPREFKPTDLDVMYNDATKDDDIRETRSVLMHLLSQVTIGMDLTKVTLPTHILERRSLLEFYASFFTHADLFINIASYGTPCDRMVALVRWYMSAYHVSLKPKRPKKPYNPVLGEVFKCYYEISDNDPTSSSTADGRMPSRETIRSDLRFIAEQVSHQPPISAFYAECPAMNITCTAHIHTKTQFRGTHVTVQLVGKGRIILHSHNEEYECTFPTVYIRSIFSTPWMEFGDSINIACRHTEMSCEIKFITKGVFGGDANTIKGYIKNKGDTIAKLTGNWTDVVFISQIVKDRKTKSGYGDNKVLFNVATATHNRMHVRSVEQQEPFESRRIWANVTYHLFYENLELATMYKNKVEEAQRQERYNRERLSVTWKPREFVSESGGWVYKNRYKPR